MKRCVVLLLAAGCGHAQVIRVEPEMRSDVREMPEPNPPRGLISETPAVSSVDQAIRKRDADMRLLSGKDSDAVAQAEGASEKDPRLVIREGEVEGTSDVIEGDCPGGTCTYAFHHGRTYALHTCHMEDLILELAPGEEVNDDRARIPTDRDPNPKRCALQLADGWCLSVTKSGDGRRGIVQDLVIRQTTSRPGTRKAWLATNYGLYRFLLHAATPGEDRCMGHVSFFHSDLDVRRQMRAAEDAADRPEVEPAVSASMLSAQYTIEVTAGNPTWVPTAVLAEATGDRGRVTIQFPPNVAWTTKPAIMVDGGVNDCRWVPETHAYVCDGLFRKALIKMGSAETGYEKVLIRKVKESS